MRRWVVLLLLVVGSGSVLYLLNRSLPREGDAPRTGRIDLDDEPGDENPAARAQYELERLRDPVTGTIPPGIRQRELQYARTLPTVERLRATGKRTGAAAVDDWTLRGPTNVAGRTRALAYDVTDPDTWLAGGVSGGMWRSTNRGLSWAKQTTPNQLHSVTCITQDTRSGNEHVWFYGTGEFLGNSASGGSATYRGDGIYRSTDGGSSWSPLPATQSGTPQDFDSDFDYVWNIVTDPAAPADSTVVLAATVGGIQRSNDAGATWTRVLGDGFAANGIRYWSDIAVTSQGVFYAAVQPMDGGATDRGFYRSTDGINWVRLRSFNGNKRTVLAVTPSNEDIVYLLADDESQLTTEVSLFRYTYFADDGVPPTGGGFIDRTNSLPDGNETDVDSLNHQNGYDMVVAVDPTNSSNVFVGGVSLYRSTNAFLDDTEITQIGGEDPLDEPGGAEGSYRYPNHHPDQHVLLFLPNGDLLSGHDGGVSITSNPYADRVQWSFRNNGYITTQFYSVAMDRGTPGPGLLIGGMQDNGGWVTPDGSTSWSIITASDGTMTTVEDGGDNYYTGKQGGRIYRSEISSGGTIINQTRIDPCRGGSRNRGESRFFTPYLLDPSDQRRMYVAEGDSIWRNDDVTEAQIPWGNTDCIDPEDDPQGWAKLGLRTRNQEDISALAMPRNGGRLYFGTTDGSLFYGENPAIGNLARTEITDPAFGGGYISSIVTDPADENRMYVTISNYSAPSIFYSDDAGLSWTDVGGNLEPGTGNGPSIRWIDVFYDGGRRIYFVGTSTGLYSTDNLDGATTVWAQEGATSIGNVVVDMVRVRQDKLGLSTDGYVAVATHGNGIYDTYYPVKRVTGTITDAAGNPVDGVVMSGLPGTPTTDANGVYEATMDWQWQGSVTPGKPGFTFNPVTRNYSGTPFRSKLDHDYAATPANTYAQVPGANLELWLKDAGLHLSYDSQSGFGQGQVFEWNDQSSTSRDFIQILPGRLPFYRPLSFNDRGGVDFDGIDDYLFKGGFSLDGEEEAALFIVLKQEGTQSGTYPFAMPHAESGQNGFDLGTNGANRMRSYVKANSFSAAEAIENFNSPGRIVSASYASSSFFEQHFIWADGKQLDAQSNGGPIVAEANKTFLGAFSDEYGGYFEGQIAEVLVYSRSLGRAERTAVENYLGLKYGLGRKVVADPVLTSSSTGVYVLGTTGAAVNFTDPPSQSGSLAATTGTNPGTTGALPPGLDAVLPDQFWTIDVFLSDYGYSLTLDVRDFDLSGVSDFADLTILTREDDTTPWQYVTGQGNVTLVHHAPYLTASGLTAFSDFAIGVLGDEDMLTVSTEADVVDADACADIAFFDLPGPDGEISLREAICAANARPEATTIIVPAGVYALSLAGTGEDANLTGDLDLGPNITLTGAGARSTIIAANGLDRVIDVRGANVIIDGVTITAGQAPDDGYFGRPGGGIRVAKITSQDASLQLLNSTVSGNVAGSGSGLTFGGSGGGIACSQYTTLEVIGSTIVYNASGDAASPGNGAGIYLTANTTATITNSTLSQNATGSSSSGRGDGGGLYAGSGAEVTLRHVTIAENDAEEGGGLRQSGSSTVVTLEGTLVAGNAATLRHPDCSGEFDSNDYNLIGNDSGCILTGTTTNTITDQDPYLGPLGAYGGPTDTHRPGFGSLALDAIPSGTLGCGASGHVDQRAQARPTDTDDDGTAACDIGAVEPTYDEIAPIVTNLNDSGTGSLRGVLAAVAEGVTITFAPSLSGETIDLTSEQLTIDRDVTVDASALPESITVQGGSDRVFHVTSAANALLSHLSIRGGSADFGGGISNDGTLTIRSSTITNNEASDRGGGIDNDGTLTLEQVTVEGNRAADGAGGINNGGVLTILSSTIYDNEGEQGGDGDGNIYNADELHLISTIIASGDGGDCINEGTLTAEYSLVEDGTCLPTGTFTNLTGDPLLGPFQDNGGGMMTYAPQPGSPVIDQGSCDGFTTDQRGEDRPADDPAISNADDGCDIGAVEVPGLDAVDLTVSTFLEGPMQSVQMAIGLTDHLPETDPYFGTQSVPSGYFTGDPDGQRVVDWIVLQLRTGNPANPPMTVAAERAALLRDDGAIFNTDGSLTVSMDSEPGSYYVVVGHRNHLWAMSNVAVDCSGGSCGFDFTAGTAHGTNALKDLGGGEFGLVAGDADSDGDVFNNDLVDFWLVQAGSSGYQAADFDLDGDVFNNDLVDFWLANAGRSTAVPLP